MPSVQANEVTYELHSLGWKAFQNLCSTITGEIWGQVVQTFFDSNDGGRDGAFSGEWVSRDGESFSGSFTVQCKFTAKADVQTKLSDLKDELKKAERLAAKGLSDNYILFSNANLTGSNEEKIREAFEKIPGIKRFSAYGRERISQIIQESARLRMLVPRVYGLGDLSQILDDRAYNQAQEILSSLGDDLSKFIITDAYRQSAKALVEHGFVLLLGEPMCGKSTIAAALSMGALDEWGCSTVKARDADDFVKHFNPNEKQLFWVDDAFGPTQLDWSSAVNWSRTFPHVNAAIHKGTKVIFTSRDYVFRAARRHLKESALPIMKGAQVVIHVENLTTDEREQILYNHIRLGTQPKSFKTELIPFLDDVASHEKFSPEIARRLGDPLFTNNLTISKMGLDNFVSKPLELLCDIINSLDDGSRSAIALVFIRGGSLPSPLTMTANEQEAVERLGGSLGDVIKGLEHLKGSLLLNSLNEGSYSWSFKHPTVRDAFAAIVASNSELLDIYLAGAPLDKLFSEISCGDVGVRGVSVIVPSSQYDLVITKLGSLDLSKWYNTSSLHSFLSYRCDKAFLQKYIETNPDFISDLSIHSYFYACSDLDVVIRLHEFGLLSENERIRVVTAIKELAVNTPDAGFLRERIKGLMTGDELSNILSHVKESLLGNLDSHINEWRSNYDGDDEPEVHFDELKSALTEYQEEFENDEVSHQKINDGLDDIDQAIEELASEYAEKTTEEDIFDKKSALRPSLKTDRSIFDDVDE